MLINTQKAHRFRCKSAMTGVTVQNGATVLIVATVQIVAIAVTVAIVVVTAAASALSVVVDLGHQERILTHG